MSRRRIEALRDITMEVEQGQVFALVGPNGAGKTTLIKILLGLLHRSQGSGQILGSPLGCRESLAHIGYLPENLRLARHLTAESACQLFGQISGLSVNQIKNRSTALLNRLALAGRESESLKSFSKGMRQRLGLILALLHDPKLLVLDEPTDGLDPIGRSLVFEIIKETKARGHTVFINSHVLREVEEICDHVAILDHGVLKFIGSLEELHRVTGQRSFAVDLKLSSDTRKANRLSEELGMKLVSRENGLLQFSADFAHQSAIDRLVDRIRNMDLSIVHLSRRHCSLEEMFLQVVDNN